jgi:predicted DsbA family dithiol-disulfide isomerase
MNSFTDKVVSFYKKIRLNPDPDVFTLVVFISIVSLAFSFYNNYQIRSGGFADRYGNVLQSEFKSDQVQSVAVSSHSKIFSVHTCSLTVKERIFAEFARAWTNYASLCAAEQNKFWQYRDVLYKKQVPEHNVGNFSDENLLDYAKSVGMDEARFSECFSSNKYTEQINKSRSFAESYGIGSTPTFIINGQMLKGAKPYMEFSTIINNILNK